METEAALLRTHRTLPGKHQVPLAGAELEEWMYSGYFCLLYVGILGILNCDDLCNPRLSARELAQRYRAGPSWRDVAPTSGQSASSSGGYAQNATELDCVAPPVTWPTYRRWNN